MPNVILCTYKNEFDTIERSFYNINRILRKNLLAKYIDYKFINVENDTDLMNNIYSILSINKENLLDVKTISYSENIVDQIIYYDNEPKKFVIIRRKIISDMDSYTFSHFKQNENVYTLIDLNENDLKSFFRSQIINKGVFISNQNTIEEYDYIITEGENNIGILYLKNDTEEKEYKYYNYSVHFTQDGEKNMRLESLTDEKVKDLRENKNVTHLMSFREIIIDGIQFANIIYFNKLICDYKINDRMSHFFNIELYDDVFLTLSEHINSDCRTINFTKELFEKMEKIKILYENTKFKIKNPYCCNPVRELMIN